ncbi:MAG: SCP2 sterol-binding domain-containing protein [Gemmatimonadota bacterium]
MSGPDPRAFYTQHIPEQWNRQLAAQEARGPEGSRVLEGMRAVDATIRVDVEGEDPLFLNIEAGRMTAGDRASHAPFLTLLQDRATFAVLAAEAGDSALAMLGGLSGLAGEMRLTRARIDLLANVNGLVRFQVTGEKGFVLGTHFGSDPVPDEPQTSIAVDEQAYRDLRAGKLDPQSAFLDGKIRVEGDMQLAMSLALAAISPD